MAIGIGGSVSAAVLGINPLRALAGSEDGFCGCSGTNGYSCDCLASCNVRFSTSPPGVVCYTGRAQQLLYWAENNNKLSSKGTLFCSACACSVAYVSCTAGLT